MHRGDGLSGSGQINVFFLPFGINNGHDLAFGSHLSSVNATTFEEPLSIAVGEILQVEAYRIAVDNNHVPPYRNNMITLVVSLTFDS